MRPPIVIQARTGSTRLPGKVLANVAGRTVLEYVILRCLQNRSGAGVTVATSVRPGDDAVETLAASLGVRVYRGSEDDVLSRYVEAARMLGADVLIRITADCPLIDPRVIDQVVEIHRHAQEADYVFVQDYPVGLGSAELVKLSALERSLAETSPGQTYYREHVVTYILDHPEKFRLHLEDAPPAFRKPNLHLAVDEHEDLEIVRHICEHFAPRIDFRTDEVLTFMEENPDLATSGIRMAREK